MLVFKSSDSKQSGKGEQKLDKSHETLVSEAQSLPLVPSLTDPQLIPGKGAASDPLPRKKKSRKRDFLAPSSQELASLYARFEQYKISQRQEKPPLLELDEVDLVQDDSLQVLPSSPKKNHGPYPMEPLKLCYDASLSRASGFGGQACATGPISTGDQEIDVLLSDISQNNIYEQLKSLGSLLAARQVSDEDFIKFLKPVAAFRTKWDHTSLMNVLGILAEDRKISGRLFSKLVSIFNPRIIGPEKISLLLEFRGRDKMVWELTNQNGKFYKSKLDDPQASLEPIKPSDSIDTTSYALIILENEQTKKKTTIIGAGHHFILSGKQHLVCFAGNICFNPEGEVVSIDDHSGGYHSPEGESPAIKWLRLENQKILLEEVGLPPDRFSPMVQPSIEKSLKQRTNRYSF